MAGYTGNILKIDLKTRRVEVERRDENFYRRYPGGGLLAGYYLYNELKPNTDALSPDNLLIYSTGIFTGTNAPGTAVHTVMAKSPLTGGIGESQACGFFGARLKKAGYDAVILYGKADKPVYIYIDDGEVKILDAAHLWGLTTGETTDRIRKECGTEDISVSAIGPAGERLVRYASIVNDFCFVNNRMGLGAVMGSKNVKAVAVRGTKEVGVHDPEKLQEIADYFRREYLSNPINQVTTNQGIASFVTALNEEGLWGSKNFQTIGFEGASKINGDVYEKFAPFDRHEPCYGCPARCKRILKDNGYFPVDARYGAPSMESITDFGVNLCIDNPEVVLQAHEYSRRMGFDSTSAGGTVAFAMECFERGILDRDQTEGLELRFGNVEVLMPLLEKIVYRQGIGDVLAEGSLRASRVIGKGSERFAMHSKGQELPMHDPRRKRMLGLSYAVNVTGPDTFGVEHDTDFDYKAPQLFMDQIRTLNLLDRFDAEDVSPGKIRMLVYLQMVFSFMDALDLCIFAFAPCRFLPFTRMVEMLNAVTGWDMSLFEIMKFGEKRINLYRMFNLREGFDARQDTLPDRIFEVVSSGKYKGLQFHKDSFEQAKQMYYSMMNWDEEGKPRAAKLYELDLGWLCN